MRSVLRQLLFGVAPKGAALDTQPHAGFARNATDEARDVRAFAVAGGLPEQLDHSKPVCVAAGKESSTSQQKAAGR